MGCDIHFFTEIKINGQWHTHSVPHINRDYNLFGKMAGVRGIGPPIVQPKGMPDNPALITRLYADYWEGDAHNASWFDKDEIKQLEEWIEKEYSLISAEFDRWGFLFGNSYSYSGDDEVEDVRFVFWFDN